MNFKIPKKRDMNKLYRLVKKVYKSGFFEFVKELGQHIFFITSKTDNIVVVIEPYEKIDFFHGEKGLLTCHLLFSGDHRFLRTYGATYFSVEKVNTDEVDISGFEYYLKKFKYHKIDEVNYAAYVSNKPGERSSVFDADEVFLAIKTLKKLLLIQKSFKKKNNFPNESEDCVCIFDFGNSKKEFSVTYNPLESFDFLPEPNNPPEVNYLEIAKDEFVIQTGILYIGELHSYIPVESYNDLTEFEVCLAPIVLYGMTEDGKMHHIIYSTPYEDKYRILSLIVKYFFRDFGLYDTVVTDNLNLIELLYEPLSNIGVDVKLEMRNPYNTFMANYVMKVVEENEDTEVVDEILTLNRENIEELISERIEDLAQFNESFFSNEESVIEEVDEEEPVDDEDLEEDSSTGYVS